MLLFRLLPAVVLGPLAGAFADRFDRRKTMVVADFLRFALFASIPLVGDLVWLFVAQFLIEAISLFWIPAKEAAVPNLLRKDQLESANQLSPGHHLRAHPGRRRARLRAADQRSAAG